MIEVLNIIHEVYDPDNTSSLLTIYSNIKVIRKNNNLNLQTIKIISSKINNTWNSLPNDGVNADNVNNFKK